MARINIEDELDADVRFKKLVQLLGDEDRAFGMLIRFWRLAQKYWGRGRALIPADEFEFAGFDPLLKSRFAERREQGIYARGSSRFEWYRQKVEAAPSGGQARAASADRDNGGRFLPDQPKPQPRTSRNPATPSVPAPAPAPAPAKKNKEERESKASSAGALPTLGQLWNQFSGSLPKIQGCSASRLRQAEARWREKPEAEYWIRVIQRIETSRFCNGENDRHWRADFDFLIQPETRHKVLEGKYDDRAPRGSPPLHPEIARLRRLAAEERGEHGSS